MPYKYFLFDLGRVLVQLRPLSFLKRFKPGLSAVEIDQWWGNLACIREFETGRIDEDLFLESAVVETGFAGTVAEFRELFAGWILGVYPGAENLLKRLRKKVRIGVLSNTNALHIDIIRRDTDLLPIFHDQFFSYQLGMLKPDQRVYAHVLEQIGMPPDNIVFFDDSQANIDAAAAAGLQSVLVSDFENLVKKIDVLMPET